LQIETFSFNVYSISIERVNGCGLIKEIIIGKTNFIITLKAYNKNVAGHSARQHTLCHMREKRFTNL